MAAFVTAANCNELQPAETGRYAHRTLGLIRSEAYACRQIAHEWDIVHRAVAVVSPAEIGAQRV